MQEGRGFTAAGSQMTAVWLKILWLSNRLTTHGDNLVSDLGLSPARWQVLGVICRAGEPLTASQVARRLDLSRQAVQRVINDLAGSGFIRMVENPADRRASRAVPTADGQAAYAEATRRGIEWANAAAEEVPATRLTDVLDMLSRIDDRLKAVEHISNHRASKGRSAR